MLYVEDNWILWASRNSSKKGVAEFYGYTKQAIQASMVVLSRKNWEVPQDLNNEWIVFAMWLIDVTLKILVIVV